MEAHGCCAGLASRHLKRLDVHTLPPRPPRRMLALGVLSLWPCWQGQLVTAVGCQPLDFSESEGARETGLQDKTVTQVVFYVHPWVLSSKAWLVHE